MTLATAQALTYPVDLIAPPENAQAFLQTCAQYILIFLPASYRFCINNTNANFPDPENQNKVWFKMTTAGRPTGTFLMYNGSWRPIYSGLPYELRYFFGNPVGLFDSTGLGLVGKNWDGWALCNGNNGTPDLRDKFILSGNYAQSAFGWYTILIDSASSTTGGTPTSPGSTSSSGASSGGSASLVLSVANLPALDCSIPLQSGFAGGPQYFALSIPNGGDPSLGGTTGETFANGINCNSEPINIVPPYVAAGLAMFIGYSD